MEPRGHLIVYYSWIGPLDKTLTHFVQSKGDLCFTWSKETQDSNLPSVTDCKGTWEDILWHSAHWKGTVSQYIPRKGSLQGTLLCFIHWKSFAEGGLSHLFYWKGRLYPQERKPGGHCTFSQPLKRLIRGHVRVLHSTGAFMKSFEKAFTHLQDLFSTLKQFY